MLPASLLTNAGVKVTFESATGKITLSRRLDTVTYTVIMTIDVPDYTWNGSAYQADVTPYMAGGEVMIPIRVVAPALGYGLTFNSTDRTATIRITSADAIGSPKDVTVIQAMNANPVTMVLAVTPDSQNVPATAGSTTFNVSNTGNGDMVWTAEVASGSSWLSISTGSN
jgi:hypothetical protein